MVKQIVLGKGQLFMYPLALGVHLGKMGRFIKLKKDAQYKTGRLIFEYKEVSHVGK